MRDGKPWGAETKITVIVAFACLLSQVIGNYLDWRQLQAALIAINGAAVPTQSEPAPSVSSWPSVVTFWASVISVFLFLFIMRRAFRRNDAFTPGSLRITKRATYDSAPGRNFPSKVYVEIANGSGDCVEVSGPRWVRGTGAVEIKIEPRVLQLRLGKGWYPDRDGETGLDAVPVGPGGYFRLWLAPDQALTKDRLQSLCDSGKLGTLAIRINGVEREIAI